ncbi:hypothetical protein FSP39_018337 [Pinctada imbricata]|uniref:Uncharacterized protein n=1 Tax=Pinctada imbricata TaxID=66713 RepID=A0AA89C463_PINIB|nr:hypothetical protein FSP39_018337 [Pinctada imbricata]
MENKRKRPPAFKIEIPASVEEKVDILEKMKKVRSHLVEKLSRPVNNFDIIENLLDFWIKSKSENTESERAKIPGAYISATRSQVNQDFFVTSLPSVKKLMATAESHGKYCGGKLIVKKVIKRGHVASLKISCISTNRARHSYQWSSSPYLPNGKYLINERINHAFLCSGMLPSHYTRFCNGARMGILSVDARDNFFKKYKIFVKEEYEESTNTALLEEIGSYEDLDGIDIITDARHGWRKNAQDTSVVAIGEQTHKVLNCVHVTKADDPVTQRHEKHGTEQVYRELDQKQVSVKVHTHDRNMAINKLVKQSKNGLTTNQNDTWHAVKSVKKAMATVSSGPMYLKERKWSEELHDKVESVATHFHWSIRNSEGDASRLTANLDNIVEHYKGNHKECHSTSRCRTDPNYESKRVIIQSPVAEKLLNSVIKNSIIYKNPNDFRLGRDTFFVESFNNTLNIYEDKRIAFGTEQYKTRSYLGTCHWNENVGREITSITYKRDPKAPRRLKGKKNYKKKTFVFRENIWNRYMKNVFSKRRK